MVSEIAVGFQAPPSGTFKDRIGLSTCLTQEQFEEYDKDDYIGVRAWYVQAN